MNRISPWLLPPLAALFAVAVWKGPESLAWKPGGPSTVVIRPIERRR